MLPSLIAYIRGWQTFPKKGPMTYALGCMVHLFSLRATTVALEQSVDQGAWPCSSKTYLWGLKLDFMFFSHVTKYSFDFLPAI